MTNLRKILEKLYEEGSFEGEHRDIHPDRIEEAHQQILALIPKKKGYGTMGEYGYNLAISDMKQSMTGEK